MRSGRWYCTLSLHCRDDSKNSSVFANLGVEGRKRGDVAYQAAVAEGIVCVNLAVNAKI
jgi:hypothetical protein